LVEACLDARSPYGLEHPDRIIPVASAVYSGTSKLILAWLYATPGIICSRHPSARTRRERPAVEEVEQIRLEAVGRQKRHEFDARYLLRLDVTATPQDPRQGHPIQHGEKRVVKPQLGARPSLVIPRWYGRSSGRHRHHVRPRGRDGRPRASLVSWSQDRRAARALARLTDARSSASARPTQYAPLRVNSAPMVLNRM
jgi:hypothetical protein